LDSYRYAINQDSDFKAAQASADAGRENTNLAWAQLLPNVSASFSRFSNDLETTSEAYNGAKTTSESRYPSSNLSLSLRQPLYRPSLYTGYKQSLLQLDGVEAELDKALQDLGIRVALAYFNILLAEEGFRYVQTQHASIVGQLKSAELGVKTGMGTRTDLDDAKARLDMNLAEQLSATQQIDQSKYELSILINQKVNNVLALDYSNFKPVPLESQSLEQWLRKAESYSPELKKLKAEVDVKRLEINRSESGHKPTVDLVVQRSDSESDNVVNPNSRFINNQIGVQVSMPIYAGGYVDSQVRKATADYKAAEEHFEAARRKLENSVRKEFKSVEQSLLKISAVQHAKTSATQAVISNEKGLQAGTRTRVDVLDALERLGSAEFNIAKEQLFYIMARLRLLALCNSLDEQEIRNVNEWFAKDKPFNLKLSKEVMLQENDKN
jgi:TolC family type I secretion outer membrane protein